MDVNALTVDVWSDVACPWCFIGKRRFEAAVARFAHRDDVVVRYHSFQLDPTLPARFDGSERDRLVQSKGLDAAQVDGMLAHVTGVGAEAGITFAFDRVVVANTRPAHELLQLANGHGAGPAVNEALLQAHFADGLDIGDAAVLRRIGEEAGIPAGEVAEALADHRLGPAVDADIAEAARLGIHAVPFYVLGGRYGLSGAQPEEIFVEALETTWREAYASA